MILPLQQQPSFPFSHPFTQVVTDVDDTLKSSGGVKIGDIALGGIDVQYARGEFYPGVFQFMLELSLSSFANTLTQRKGGKHKKGWLFNNENDKQNYSVVPPKVAVLTARAEEFKVALELKEDSKLAKQFRKTGEISGYDDWGLGPVLYGSVVEWVIQGMFGL